MAESLREVRKQAAFKAFNAKFSRNGYILLLCRFITFPCVIFTEHNFPFWFTAFCFGFKQSCVQFPSLPMGKLQFYQEIHSLVTGVNQRDFTNLQRCFTWKETAFKFSSWFHIPLMLGYNEIKQVIALIWIIYLGPVSEQKAINGNKENSGL